MKITLAERSYQWVIRVFVITLSVTCFYPLFYVLALSFTSQGEFVKNNGLVFLPAHPMINTYISVIAKTPAFLNSFKVSIMRVVLGTAVTLVFTLIMGYVLSRRRLPGRKALLIFVLITILFPGGLIPTYMIVKDAGLLNKFLVYIIPAMVDSWGVLVFKQFFENVPHEMEESAEIDGASEIRMMLSIIIPMSTAVVAAWSLFIAVGQWNSWFDALIYVRDSKLMPVQLIMYNLFQNSLSYMQTTTDFSKMAPDISLKMTITVIGTVPILLVYPFLQKYFINGVYTGSVKG